MTGFNLMLRFLCKTGSASFYLNSSLCWLCGLLANITLLCSKVQ